MEFISDYTKEVFSEEQVDAAILLSNAIEHTKEYPHIFNSTDSELLKWMWLNSRRVDERAYIEKLLKALN